MILNAVRLPEFNDSAEKMTEIPAPPPKVIVSLWQNIGAPCEPLVKKGDHVMTGQVIGDADAFISVPVHSPVSGTVTDETQVLRPDGKVSRALVIENESDNSNNAADSPAVMHESVKPPVLNDKADFLKAVRDSGSVGLGGAGFPTHAKLSFDSAKNPVDTLIINAAECEPFVTGDYREIMENSANIIEGIELVMKYIEIPKAVIGVEKNKPKGIALLNGLLKGKPAITVKPLPTKYPQGAEKILIHQTTGKLIKEGELPLHSGCLVLNVSTVSFLSEYMKTGVPLIKKRVTVDGDAVRNAVNVLVPVGTTLEDLMKSTGLKEDRSPERIVFGGPMMGHSVFDARTPVTKTTGAVLFFGGAEGASAKESACIRCGKCIHVCSMNLSPYEMNKAYDAKNAELLKKLTVNLCMNCGACSFVCPAKRNVSEKNQLAKQLIK